jgi:hypothetical protein
LQTIANDFGFAVFAMLARGKVAFFNGALVAETLGALKEQLYAFTTA